jgi:hypothetical protein
MHPLRIYHVQHIMKVGKTYQTVITDLIFDGTQPIAVLEWVGSGDNERPQVCVKLDPSHLQEFRSGDATHLYDIPIEDPRPMPQTNGEAPGQNQ